MRNSAEMRFPPILGEPAAVDALADNLILVGRVSNAARRLMEVIE
jgi:hypothetical protein